MAKLESALIFKAAGRAKALRQFADAADIGTEIRCASCLKHFPKRKLLFCCSIACEVVYEKLQLMAEALIEKNEAEAHRIGDEIRRSPGFIPAEGMPYQPAPEPFVPNPNGPPLPFEIEELTEADALELDQQKAEALAERMAYARAHRKPKGHKALHPGRLPDEPLKTYRRRMRQEAFQRAVAQLTAPKPGA